MAEGTAAKLMRGSLWLTVAGLIINLLQALSTIIVAYFLTPEDYGLVAIALTLLAIVTALTNMQLGEALIRQEDPGEQEISAVWTLGVIRGLIMATIFVVLARPVAHFYEDPRLESILLVLGLSPILLGLENPKRFIQQRGLVFRQEFLITVLQKIVGFIVTVGIAIIWQSYWALILGNIALSGSGTLISYILMRYRPRFTFKGLRDIFGFSVWVTLAEMTTTLNGRFEYFLISKILGVGQLGIYSLGIQLAQVPTAEAVKPLRKVIYPGFANVIKADNIPSASDRIKRAYLRAQSFLAATVLPIGFGFGLVADPLIRLLMEERWHEVIFVVQYAAAVFAFQSLSALVPPLAMSKSRTRFLFLRDVQMLVIRVPIIVGGMLWWGLPGIIAGRVIAGLIAVWINMRMVQKLIDLSIAQQLRANARSLLSIAVMTASLLALSVLLPASPDDTVAMLRLLILKFLAGVFSYVGTHLLLWYLMGKPEGPETELLGILRKIYGKLRRSPSVD